MAIFTNFATLSYNGGTTNSNTVTGEIREALTLTKTPVSEEYTTGSSITYVLALVNTGTTAYTGLTVTDNLGGYTVGTNTVYPLAYQTGSLRYYANGVLQATPTITAGPPLVISGITVPANGNAILIYQTDVTGFAPLAPDDTVTNTATVTGGCLSGNLTASATIETADTADLSITKSVSPTVVSENGQLTYTFLIENRGNTPAVATDSVVLTDTFNPILEDITVTLNGVVLAPGTGYTYNTATGVFATVPGVITVPAATYSQNLDGTWVTTPGTATLVITGTV